MRIQPRKGNGRYKQSNWYNFKKKKRGWKEYAWHPFTAATFALLAYLTMGIAQATEEYKNLDGKIELFNADFTKFREPLKISQDTDDAEGDTGETAGDATPTTSPVSEVEAVSDREPRESEEGSTPVMEVASSSVEAKILKAWEGTGKGHIAVAVAKGESKLRSDAVGDKHLEFWAGGKKMGHSCGIFQIRVLPGRPDCETLKDTNKNIEYARKLYDRAGFNPWTVFTKGTYLKYL